MKFFHLADLHLGKSVYEHSLLADQRHVLNQVTAAVRAERPAAVIIAGDVFDRAVPPPEAVRLFGDFLAELKAVDPGLVIAVIPGNHDSGARLSFASGILGLSGVHIRSEAHDVVSPVRVHRDGQTSRLWLLPFLGPGALSSELLAGERAEPKKPGPEGAELPGLAEEKPEDPRPSDTTKPAEQPLLRSQADLFAAAVSLVQKARTQAALEDESAAPSPADILVCHAFAAGGAAGESERIFLGTAESVNPALFESFDYVALGHLHRCQTAGAKGRYPGSPIAYTFGEGQQDRGFLSVEVRTGSFTAEFRRIQPLRRMVRLQGAYDDLRHDPRWREYEADYIEAVLDNADAILSPMGPLRERFPFLLSIRQESFDRGKDTVEDQDFLATDDQEGSLAQDDFVAFHQELRKRPPEPYLMELFSQLYREATDETP